jgi:hypothetical protein
MSENEKFTRFLSCFAQCNDLQMNLHKKALESLKSEGLIYLGSIP